MFYILQVHIYKCALLLHLLVYIMFFFLTHSMLFMSIRMVPGYLETNEKMC